MNNLNIGDKCKHCGAILELRETRKRTAPRKTKYYFTHLFRCPDCKRIYLSDKYKFFVKRFEMTKIKPQKVIYEDDNIIIYKKLEC